MQVMKKNMKVRELPRELFCLGFKGEEEGRGVGGKEALEPKRGVHEDEEANNLEDVIPQSLLGQVAVIQSSHLTKGDFLTHEARTVDGGSRTKLDLGKKTGEKL